MTSQCMFGNTTAAIERHWRSKLPIISTAGVHRFQWTTDEALLLFSLHWSRVGGEAEYPSGGIPDPYEFCNRCENFGKPCSICIAQATCCNAIYTKPSLPDRNEVIDYLLFHAMEWRRDIIEAFMSEMKCQFRHFKCTHNDESIKELG